MIVYGFNIASIAIKGFALLFISPLDFCKMLLAPVVEDYRLPQI